MAEDSAQLPRWGGITEPMTVATDVVLAVLAFGFAVRLSSHSTAERSVAAGCLAAAMMVTGLAALLGAVAHGADAARDALRQRSWRYTVYVTGFIGAAIVASVAFFAARGGVRTALLILAAIKLVVFMNRVARQPAFEVVAADYGTALAILLVGAASEMVRRRAPGMTWLIVGVLVSLVASVVQTRRLALHRHFNHNDLYHVIQMAALYAFYRGGALLVDGDRREASLTLHLPSARAYAVVMAVLLVLFVGRVAGQILAATTAPAWLPPMARWYSGLMPYRWLLPTQIVLVLVMTAMTIAVGRRLAPLGTLSARAGAWVVRASYVYALGMVFRSIRYALATPEQRGVLIPIVFHFALAAILFAYGSSLIQNRDGTRLGS